MSEWKKSKLEEIGEVHSGATPKTNIKEYWDGSIVWITPNDLNKLKTRYVSDSERKLTEAGFKSCSTHLMPKGSIVLSSRAPIGYLAIASVECCTNQGCKSIVLKDGHDPEYHYYNLLFNVDKLKRLGEGTTFSEISKSFVKKVEVKYPSSRREQTQIATVLSTIDQAIEQTEALIAKHQRIKTGLMQDLLTKGIDEQGNIRSGETHEFKDSPLGRIPVEWEVRKLEQCVHSDITYGIVQAGPHIPNGIPYIRTGDMAGSRLSIENLLRTSESIAAKYKRSTVRTGEIVFALRATVGKVLEVPQELDGANLTQGTARIAPSKGIHNRYLLWALRSHAVLQEIELVKKGTTFFEVTLGDLRQIEVPLPSSIKEQVTIGKMIETVESSLEATNSERAKLQRIKSGLMQGLLTGKVRVNHFIQEATPSEA